MTITGASIINLRTLCFLLLVWSLLSGISEAKQVFLQDGSELDCQSVWRTKGRIVVKVNRDVVLEFEPSEVDLAKTFHPVPRRSLHAKRMHHAVKPHPPHAKAAPISAATSHAAAPPNKAKASIVEHGDHRKVAAAKAAPAALANKDAAAPNPAQPAQTAAPLTREEVKRRSIEIAKTMADGIRKDNPEKIKSATEAQKALTEQQKREGIALVQPAAPKPSPKRPVSLWGGVAASLVLVLLWIGKKARKAGSRSGAVTTNGVALTESNRPEQTEG